MFINKHPNGIRIIAFDNWDPTEHVFNPWGMYEVFEIFLSARFRRRYALNSFKIGENQPFCPFYEHFSTFLHSYLKSLYPSARQLWQSFFHISSGCRYIQFWKLMNFQSWIYQQPEEIWKNDCHSCLAEGSKLFRYECKMY